VACSLRPGSFASHYLTRALLDSGPEARASGHRPRNRGESGCFCTHETTTHVTRDYFYASSAVNDTTTEEQFVKNMTISCTSSGGGGTLECFGSAAEYQ